MRVISICMYLGPMGVWDKAGKSWRRTKIVDYSISRPTIYSYAVVMAALHSRCEHYIFLLFLPSTFLYSSSNLRRRRLDIIPYFDTWCGRSANLECRSETCCALLAGNAGPKKRQKVAIWAPSHNFSVLYLRN